LFANVDLTHALTLIFAAVAAIAGVAAWLRSRYGWLS
jgi:hypothetical protein